MGDTMVGGVRRAKDAAILPDLVAARPNPPIQALGRQGEPWGFVRRKPRAVLSSARKGSRCIAYSL